MLKTLVVLPLLAAVPSSTNYTLRAYDFGNGSGSSTSSSYNLQSSVNGNGGSLASSSYMLPAGIRASATAPAPAAPAFSNPDNSYSRLRLSLASSGTPSDAKYAVAISDDNFTTTKYVQPDQTIGATFAIASYQSYAAWGGAGGTWVLGLQSNTIYKVKVSALQGSTTASAFGPTASATTTVPSVTFGVTTSLTATPPFALSFPSLAPGSPTAANATINAAITANSQQGAAILVKSQNAGLASASKSYTLSSATTDLAAAGQGYGARVGSIGQGSGGPLLATTPFDGAGNNVGGLTTTLQSIASSVGPVSTGSLTVSLMAKSSGAVPAAADYTDTITIALQPSF
jgi:hypothetical protein